MIIHQLGHTFISKGFKSVYLRHISKTHLIFVAISATKLKFDEQFKK